MRIRHQNTRDLVLVVVLALAVTVSCRNQQSGVSQETAAKLSPTATVVPETAAVSPMPANTATAEPTTVPDEVIPLATLTSITADASSAISISATTSPEEMAPYVRLVHNFLFGLQSGLMAADSGPYMSRDLQAAVISGRPLPTIVGIRDLFPSFVLTDLTDNSRMSGAQVRATFNFDYPTYAIFFVITEDGVWKIDSVGQHNLVRNIPSRDLLDIETTIIAYYQALAEDQVEAAFAWLSSAAQSSSSIESLTLRAQGLQRVTVTTMQPVRAGEDEVSYYVHLYVSPDPVNPGDWRVGDNPRWLTLVRTDEGWHIDSIIRSPQLAGIASWQRVTVAPIQMTLEIPGDWIRPGMSWTWSPNSLGVPGIGIDWADLGEFGGDETLLPRYRHELSTEDVDLGWAQGTQYSYETLGGIGEGPINAETRMIVRTGRRAYGFYAVANSVEELGDMRPILERMVSAVAITELNARAFNSVETSVSFLATLLRDASGAGSLPYLSDPLRAGITDRQGVLNLLNLDEVFSSFDVSWLENTASGQARIAVAIYYPNAPDVARLFTLEAMGDDTWRIIAIE